MMIYYRDRRSPYAIMREEFETTYPDAKLVGWSWDEPKGVEVLAQIQVRHGDPYFWVVRPLPTAVAS